MIKECVVLNGRVINIGPWNYEIRPVEIEPAQQDEEGKIIKSAVYENRVTNPLPEGATIEEREFEFDEEQGWREAGTPHPKTQDQIIQEQKQQIDDLTLALGDFILSGGA